MLAFERAVTGKKRLDRAWSRFVGGFDHMEPDHFWAKVYFDPDQSGSAVIRIANSIFVSATENYV